MIDDISDEAAPASPPTPALVRQPAFLPPSAAEKFAHLRVLHDDAVALLTAVSGGGQPEIGRAPEIQHWRREVDALEKADWGRIISEKLKTAALPKAEHDAAWNLEKARLDARLEAARTKLEGLLADRDRARELHARRKDRRQRTGSLISHIEQWLSQRSGLLKPVATEPVKLLAGQTLDAELIAIRDLITALTAERKRVDAAGPPPAEAKRSARAWVERRGQLVQVRAIGGNFNVQLPEANPALALACFLSPEKVVARLERAIDEQSDGRLTMSELDKAKKLAELDTKLLSTERQEEALVVALEGEGRDLLRRRNADPRAVLGVE